MRGMSQKVYRFLKREHEERTSISKEKIHQPDSQGGFLLSEEELQQFADIMEARRANKEARELAKKMAPRK